MWIFTNEKGEVTRVDNVPYHTITTKLTQGALEKELVAVLQKVGFVTFRANMAMGESQETM